MTLTHPSFHSSYRWLSSVIQFKVFGSSFGVTVVWWIQFIFYYPWSKIIRSPPSHLHLPLFMKATIIMSAIIFRGHVTRTPIETLWWPHFRFLRTPLKIMKTLGNLGKNVTALVHWLVSDGSKQEKIQVKLNCSNRYWIDNKLDDIANMTLNTALGCN